MIAKVYSAIPDGYTGQIIDVEGDTTKGLPAFHIVGMANKTIFEARERVRSAIMNSNFTFPTHKVAVNLAPAELIKNGSHLDLPIALNVLTLSGQLLQEHLTNRLFVGELSLDGHIKPIRGIINIVETARNHGFTEVYLPSANLAQASLIQGISLFGVNNLFELILHLQGIKPLSPPKPLLIAPNSSPDPTPCLDDISGQDLAKRALVIAIAGHHNLLLSGPPGVGKTMLAQTSISLLPPLSLDEKIELTKIYTLSKLHNDIIQNRPFRSPHHSASDISILGGGNSTLPGEISLAHHGILLLDELPEFSRTVLESLRQPLEDRQITIARSSSHVTYPANFMLIATMNPCPCGFYNSPTHPCTCTQTQIQNYRKKLSGPILDRIDLTINVAKPQSFQPTHHKNASQHQKARTDIQKCLQIQRNRYQKATIYNSSLTPPQIRQFANLSPKANQLIRRAQTTFELSGRAYFKIIKVARTIADLEAQPQILAEHISEALALRQQFS